MELSIKVSFFDNIFHEAIKSVRLQMWGSYLFCCHSNADCRLAFFQGSKHWIHHSLWLWFEFSNCNTYCPSGSKQCDSLAGSYSGDLPEASQMHVCCNGFWGHSKLACCFLPVHRSDTIAAREFCHRGEDCYLVQRPCLHGSAICSFCTLVVGVLLKHQKKLFHKNDIYKTHSTTVITATHNWQKAFGNIQFSRLNPLLRW